MSSFWFNAHAWISWSHLQRNVKWKVWDPVLISSITEKFSKFLLNHEARDKQSVKSCSIVFFGKRQKSKTKCKKLVSVLGARFSVSFFLHRDDFLLRHRFFVERAPLFSSKNIAKQSPMGRHPNPREAAYVHQHGAGLTQRVLIVKYIHELVEHKEWKYVNIYYPLFEWIFCQKCVL